jgi:hypothetical protein
MDQLLTCHPLPPLVLRSHQRPGLIPCWPVVWGWPPDTTWSTGKLEKNESFFLKSFFSKNSIGMKKPYTVKKRLATFPSPAGISFTKLFLSGNNFYAPEAHIMYLTVVS